MKIKVKRTFFLLLFGLLISNAAHSQYFVYNYLYLSAEQCIGTHLGVNLAINYVYQDKLALTGGYSFLTQQAQQLPEDYEIISFLPEFIPGPNDYYDTGYLLVGYVLYPFKNKKLRFNLLGGVSYSRADQAIFYKISYSEYSYYTRNFYRTGFIFNPKFEISLKREAGFSISPMFMINEKTTYYGLGLGVMFGIVREALAY